MACRVNPAMFAFHRVQSAASWSELGVKSWMSAGVLNVMGLDMMCLGWVLWRGVSMASSPTDGPKPTGRTTVLGRPATRSLFAIRPGSSLGIGTGPQVLATIGLWFVLILHIQVVDQLDDF